MERDTLGTGHLAVDQPGILTGTATLDVRGQFPMTGDLVQRDANGHPQQFRLRVGRDECVMMWADTAPEQAEWPVMEFHGFIRLEGYQMMVRAAKGDAGLSVRFVDAVQPLPPKPEWFVDEGASDRGFPAACWPVTCETKERQA